MSARLVVTLPPSVRGDDAVAFAGEAARRRADLLEVRTDLHADADVDAARLASILPLVVSARGRPVAGAWREVAALVDTAYDEVARSPGARGPTRPAGAPRLAGDARPLASMHVDAPLRPEDAAALWRGLDLQDDALVKHVEPLGDPADGWRLLETRRLLSLAYGAARVTVLATGPLALPFRAVLAEENALDYVALSASWQAAPGQRLLDDAVRARRAAPGAPRTAILGSSIAHSRSPRIHAPPFDRVDLPPDAPVAALLSALLPRYRGFAVTSPFKKAAARAVGSDLPAVNTLVRRRGEDGLRYEGGNTDVEGARAVLERLGDPVVTVLGDGGVTAALRMAAGERGARLSVLRRDQVGSAPLSGAVVWTWPADLEPPPALSFRGARVAVVAYGAPARRIAGRVRERGGEPLLLGARWFVAQARAQRRLWEDRP